MYFNVYVKLNFLPYFLDSIIVIRYACNFHKLETNGSSYKSQLIGY